MTILFLVCEETGIFILCNSSGLLDCNVPVRSWLRHCASSRQVAVLIPDYVFRNFYCLWHWPHCGPGVDSASNRNEYQEYLLGGLQLYHLHMTIVMKSVRLNLLEPSGTVIDLYGDCFTFYCYQLVLVCFSLNQTPTVINVGRAVA